MTAAGLPMIDTRARPGLAADLDRDGQAESFRSLEVDHQFKFGGLFDREVGGLRTLEDLVDVDGRQQVVIGQQR